MNAKETLLKLLFDDARRHHINMKFWRGTDESVSEEQLCTQVASAIVAHDKNLLPSTGALEGILKQVEISALKARA